MLQMRHQLLTSCSRLKHHHRCQHSSRVCARAAHHAACRTAPTPLPAVSRPSLTAVGPSSACETAAAPSHATAACSSRATSIVCRDAPRPMWAAKQPDETPKVSGSALARIITSEIAQCSSVAELSSIYDEWGSSFDFIHAAAALVKCGKLPGGSKGSSKGDSKSRLVDKLCSTWLSQLPLSGTQGCGNVLWACVRLGPGAVQRLWDPTWEAYIALVQQESAVEGACQPQTLANPLWACAKLRRQPPVDELQLLVQAFLQPGVLKNATAHDFANVTWALGDLYRGRGWKGGASEQDVQQLLGTQQLLVVAGGRGQSVSNVLLSLARMAEGAAPLVSVATARESCEQLLALTYQRTATWNPQDFTNALWACGQLGLADTPFIAVAVAAAPRWVPRSLNSDVAQALTACGALRLGNEAFMRELLQQGLRMLEQQPGNKKGPIRPVTHVPDRDILAAIASFAVAQQDMRALAGMAVHLVSCSGVGQRPSTRVSNLSRLWVFHNWLLQHQLLDGKGLAGVLTEQQLQLGAKDAAAYGRNLSTHPLRAP